MKTFTAKTREMFETARASSIVASLLDVSEKDYDDAVETYIHNVCVARGYTSREPSPFYDLSENPRWASDAKVFRKFRDAVLGYACEVENMYLAGKQVPTLDEFKTHLKTIVCQWEDN